MKKVIILLVLTTPVFTLKVTAQRSKNDPTPIHSTKLYQQEEKNMAGVVKWLAWGDGYRPNEEAMLKRQDPNVEVMATKEFSRGVMPVGKDIVMFKADAFNLAQMNNYFGLYKADYTLSKEKPNLFLFRHGYYMATYDDVRESYYFDYHAQTLTPKDPILKKNGCKVFWINWEGITKEVKPVDSVAIANEKYTIIISSDEENAKYLHALNAAAAKLQTEHEGLYVSMIDHGYVHHLIVEKEGHSNMGDHIASMEFQIDPDPSRFTDGVSQSITFVYDHTKRKGTILWLTSHGKVRYHSEEETKEKLDQLITQLNEFI